MPCLERMDFQYFFETLNLLVIDAQFLLHPQPHAFCHCGRRKAHITNRKKFQGKIA